MERKALLKKAYKKGRSSISALNDMYNTIQIDHMRRMDEFFVLQHVIRRFKMRHKTDFLKLLDLRTAVSEVLNESLPRGKDWAFSDQLFESSLWYCLRLLDSKINLKKLEHNETRWVSRQLKDDLKEILNPSVLMNVDVVDIPSIAKIIINFGADISDMNRRLNYLNFYSLLGLTCHVSGNKLYTHYMKAKRGHHKINKPYSKESLIDHEARWMFTEESANDDDLSVLLKTRCASPLKVSKNVEIYGGLQHSITINNIPLKNRLVLSVPTNETPDKIDDALREFRVALMEEFIANCGAYANISSENFDNSVFMTHFTHNTCLIDDWDQVQKYIIGLWSWDVANQRPCSIETAIEEVALHLENFKKEEKHSLPIYKDSTIHDYHLNANKIIGSRKSSKPTKMDYFISGTESILGEI